MNIDKFFKQFPNEKACLNYFKRLRYPDGIFCKKCDMITKFTRIKKRPVFECSCGFQVSILAGTIFSKTHLPLQYWFYCIFAMTSTRSGVSAKTIQRELGISYKGAWRMMKQVRTVMAFAEGELLDGVVEVDEVYIGGRGFNRGKQWWGNWEERPKQIVMGMVERNGRVAVKHIPVASASVLIGEIKKRVHPEAHVMTDQLYGYRGLSKNGYKHDSVKHSKHYVDGNIYTNNIENVWSQFRRGTTGVYRHVSPKYLQSYADEYAWRYSNRNSGNQMFDLLMERAIL